jgi:hypothetical protein
MALPRSNLTSNALSFATMPFVRVTMLIEAVVPIPVALIQSA